MKTGPFANISYEVRYDIIDSHNEAWHRLAAPGTWLNSDRRISVVAEIRQALSCQFCKKIKAALSPNVVSGSHETTNILSDTEVELIHRSVSDPGRLSKTWAQDVLSSGIKEGEYVEIVGIIASVMIMDTTTMALGAENRMLPNVVPGEPTRYLPPGASVKAAWLPIVEPEDAVETDKPLYPNSKVGYIYRALSMVPESLRNYWALANAHYLSGEYVYKFDKNIRAISRAQIELIAARVSGLHQCAY
jgi:alkylhydroperoxidase family enzyme